MKYDYDMLGTRLHQYSVAFQTKIPKVGAGTRGAHFKAANEALASEAATNPDLAAMLEKMNIKIPVGTGGSVLGESPRDWSWHHVSDEPGVMELVPRGQHQGSAWQSLLHPNQQGGFKLWGADY